MLTTDIRPVRSAPGRTPPTPMPALRSSSRGFTLIEVLITLLLTATTLLALASLQLRTLQQTHFSYQRTLANLQASDLMEHLWLARCALPENLSDFTESHPVFQTWYQQHQSTSFLPGWQARLHLLNTEQLQLSLSWQDRQSELLQQTSPLNYPLFIHKGSC
ncbi:prepilin-type N-terminal cleavage/methylation domain-containing protein [Nitrincola alkalilacustris]|uniref:prepilin-type N-terminal cleavage/methylation domain-containing protein n=1 Tax=Nitrincola alkalilacustris TaxID=1571224 RepID=UPI00197FD95F|nr:prepilin-type N-terminal cleavage/methylation domain-containing protein [Nitrincola alkalilacustris]